MERVAELLFRSGTDHSNFPPTQLYNEGWLLRLVLEWFSTQTSDTHPLRFVSGARWFSEGWLPSQFLAAAGLNRLAEGWTHADGVIGHFGFGGSGAWADPSRRLSVAMVVNSGMGTPFGDLRILRIGGLALAAAEHRGDPAPRWTRWGLGERPIAAPERSDDARRTAMPGP